jgi:hypothetical protein
MPASIIALRRGVELQAGPMVAMTLVLRNFLRAVRGILQWQRKPGDYKPVLLRNHFS